MPYQDMHRVAKLENVDPSEEIYTYRLNATRPINQDAIWITVLRDTFYPPNFYLRSCYLSPEHKWIEYRPYAALEATLVIPGLTEVRFESLLAEQDEATIQLVERLRGLIKMYDDQEESSAGKTNSSND